jgi:hypothetical protein
MFYLLRQSAIIIVISALLLICAGVTYAGVTKHFSKEQNVPADLGVDTAVVKTPTSLFVDPDTASAKIGILRPNDLTVLVSRDIWNGWYRIIQYSSGHQGWVRANRLFPPIYTSHRKPGVTISAISTGTSDPPVMEVNNDSDIRLYLHVDKLAEMSVSPHTTQSLPVKAGIFSFNAAGPNVLPDFGFIAFLNGNKYPWRFFIRSAHTQKAQSIVTPQMISDYNIKLADVNAKQATVEIEKQQIDDARDALHKQGDKVKAEADDIDLKRASLDHSDEKSVSDFNSLVDTSNSDLDTYNKMKDDFNTRVVAYNSYLDTLNAEKQQLDALESAVNTPR